MQTVRKHLQWFSVECGKTKTQINYSSQSQRTHNTVNQSKLEAITGS